MKMADKRVLDDAELDGLFEAARDIAPLPPVSLVERILADAEAERFVPVASVPPRRGFSAILRGIGGWPAATGLAAAAITGVMIGIVTPDTVGDLTGGYLATGAGYQLEDLLPSYGDLLGEG